MTEILSKTHFPPIITLPPPINMGFTKSPSSSDKGVFVLQVGGKDELLH